MRDVLDGLIAVAIVLGVVAVLTPASARALPELGPIVGLPAKPSPPADPSASRLFAPSSVWNAPVPANAPLAADSAALVARLARETSARGAWINTTEWSTPVYVVPASQRTVPVRVARADDRLNSDMAAVPIPRGARPAAGDDAQLTVWQPSTDTAWELWRARRGVLGRWSAEWGGRIDSVSTSPGWLRAPYGATATSLPLLGGLIMTSEMRSGRIDHALALAVPAPARRFVPPAQRGDGYDPAPDAIPEGTRFRLDPTVNVEALGLPPVGVAIARAMQRYGAIVRDRAGSVTFYAEDPAPTGGDPYPRIMGGQTPKQVLARFPWHRLQVVAPGR